MGQMPVHALERIDVWFRGGPLCALGSPGTLLIVNQHYITSTLVLKRRAYFVAQGLAGCASRFAAVAL